MTERNTKKIPPEDFLFDFSEQDEARNCLWRAYRSGRFASAYLFSGPAGVGKFVAALEIVKFLKCENKQDGSPCGKCQSCRSFGTWDNPDVLIIFPMPSTVWEKDLPAREAYEEFRKSPHMRPTFTKPAWIIIDMIRTVPRFLATPASFHGGKFVLVPDADRMNKPAANAFLKTLEEPPPDSHIILTTDKAESLLPTIRSRTQPVRFRRMSTEQVFKHLVERYNFSPEQAESMAKLAEGSIATALRFASDDFQKVRDTVIRIFAEAAQGNIIELWTWANEAPPKSDYAEIFLRISISLARDVAAKLADTEILNSDADETISLAAQRINDPIRAIEFIRQIDNLRKDLGRNPQYTLIYGAIVATLVKAFAT